jgi:hypothetical protein
MVCGREGAYLYILASIGGNLALEVLLRLALCLLQVLLLGRLANGLREESGGQGRGSPDGIELCGPGGKGSDASLGRDGPRGRDGGPQRGATKRVPKPLSITLSKKEGIHPAARHIHFDVALVEMVEWDSGFEDDVKCLLVQPNQFFFVERGCSR